MLVLKLGFVFDKLSNLRDAFERGAPDEDNTFNAATKVVLPDNSVRFIRLSADELTVVVALRGGQVQLYSAASLLGNVSGVFFLCFSTRVVGRAYSLSSAR